METELIKFNILVSQPNQPFKPALLQQTGPLLQR
jgi:hypothetical protein